MGETVSELSHTNPVPEELLREYPEGCQSCSLVRLGVQSLAWDVEEGLLTIAAAQRRAQEDAAAFAVCCRRPAAEVSSVSPGDSPNSAGTDVERLAA